MKELNEEIKLTLDLMQGDIDDGAHSELRYHLVCLMEIKRERLVTETGLQAELERDRERRLQFGDPDKPLTVDEYLAGLSIDKDGYIWRL